VSASSVRGRCLIRETFPLAKRPGACTASGRGLACVRVASPAQGTRTSPVVDGSTNLAVRGWRSCQSQCGRIRLSGCKPREFRVRALVVAVATQLARDARHWQDASATRRRAVANLRDVSVNKASEGLISLTPRVRLRGCKPRQFRPRCCSLEWLSRLARDGRHWQDASATPRACGGVTPSIGRD
jgi:hypothetical protein